MLISNLFLCRSNTLSAKLTEIEEILTGNNKRTSQGWNTPETENFSVPITTDSSSCTQYILLAALLHELWIVLSCVLFASQHLTNQAWTQFIQHVATFPESQGSSDLDIWKSNWELQICMKLNLPFTWDVRFDWIRGNPYLASPILVLGGLSVKAVMFLEQHRILSCNKTVVNIFFFSQDATPTAFDTC